MVRAVLRVDGPRVGDTLHISDAPGRNWATLLSDPDETLDRTPVRRIWATKECGRTRLQRLPRSPG